MLLSSSAPALMRVSSSAFMLLLLLAAAAALGGGGHLALARRTSARTLLADLAAAGAATSGNSATKTPAPSPSGGAAPTWKPRIPMSVSHWDYWANPGDDKLQPNVYSKRKFPGDPGHGRIKRWWDRAMLKESIFNLDHGQWRPFLDKLHRGEPVVVLVMGSSVSITCGACYPAVTPPEMMHKYVEGLPFHFGDCQQNMDGWVRMFMGFINATWPHKDHIAINMAVSGAGIAHFMSLPCLEAGLPRPNITTDLVLVENRRDYSGATFINRFAAFDIPGGREDPGALERLMLRVNRHVAHPARPAYVLLLPLSVTYTDESRKCVYGEEGTGDYHATCRNQTLCGGFKSAFTPGNQDLGGERAEEEFHRLARHYKISSLSHRKMFTTLVEDRVYEELNTTECEMLGSVVAEIIHPSHLGQVLMADMLTLLLSESEQAIAAERSDPDHTPGMEAEYIPPHPFDPNATDIFAQRCYGFVHRDWNTVPFPVVEAQGFVTVTTVVVPTGPKAGKHLYKPGLEASAPGSYVVLELDTTFTNTPGAPNTTTVQMGLLRSYERFGRARITCVANCTCAPSTADAFHTDRTSLTELHTFAVTPHTHCRIRVEVLPESSAPDKGTRFKIVHIVAEVKADISA